MKKKILIIGANPVGLEVMRQLVAKNQQVRLIDDHHADVSTARLQGFNVDQINLQDDAALKRAGIGQYIDVLFALLEDEASNVFLVISARFLDPKLQIVSIGGTEDTIARLKSAGANKVIDPYKISGFKIFEYINRPVIAETLEKTVFGQADLEIAEVKIPKQSLLIGQILQNIYLSQPDLIILGIITSQADHSLILASHPQPHRISRGDILLVIGPKQAIEAFEHQSD